MHSFSTANLEADTAVDIRQGIELRELGRQILDLNEVGRIQSSLVSYETASIQGLIDVVTASETVLVHRS